MARTTGIRKNQSGNFEARFRRKGLPEISKSFNTMKAAKAWLDTMNAKAAAGKSVASPDSFTVGEALEDYARYIAKPVLGKDGKPTLDESHEPVMKVDPRKAAYLNGLLPHLGKFSIGFLRAKHIKKFVDLMETTPIPRPRHAKRFHPMYDGDKSKFYAESTIRKFVYALKSALDHHARQHGYTYDPHLFSEDKPPAWDNVRKRRLEDGEQERILDACRNIITRDDCGTVVGKRGRKHGEAYAALVRFLLETGARLQEALLAEWSEFDTNNHVWTIPPEHIKTEKRSKNKKPREVPLSKIAVSIVVNMRDISVDKEQVFGQLPKGKAVFITWKRICKDAQVKDFGFHDLRHECICRWVLRGGSDLQISKAAGHDISVMQKYAGLRGRELLSFVDA